MKAKEDLKPSVSNGVFCILFVAVDKKYAAGGTAPTKEKHPSERKRKPAKRERIPTTSLRTGLGMTGLAYERIFQQPNKVYTSLHGVIARKPPKRRLWRIQRGGFEEVSRFSRHNVAGNRLTRRCVLLPTFPAGGKSGPPEAVPYKRKAPVGTKRKPARRERIPTTSLRTGLGMTGLAYERIFQRPNKACAFLCQSVLHGRMAAVPAKRKNSACFLSPGHI